ncbi:Wadjet anti-phage system protein JetD domain-containing protein [Chryseobacterium populi]|uniref:Wadjet protein JetD C-terminal domain-containing protein n=1 Tax=Chryseobacterium populi TaxID=1144316 RepID=J3CG43_9FLAO|nr:DUF3322 and DUF2220 domain-containing protein [Chryseobacterium populi]EJL70716.1 hypothetical protein PMI13_02719 [Chryseobacterium populi]
MISPAEIKKQALKWWKPLLQSHIQKEPFFPKIIDRIGKVKSAHITERFEILQKEIEELYHYSKNQTGKGYLVQTADRNFRRTGSHDLPDTIIFESLEDYLYFTGYQKYWKVFLKYYDTIISTIPVLKDWTLQHCLWLTDHHINWNDVLKVCRYFMETPRPNLYLRQLPIEIHTKFIEENNILIQSLLDFLIPDHVRSAKQKRFAERFFLRYDEPLIRLCFLDENPNPDFKFRDISIPLSDFETLEILVENILITENKMNFLTLPLLGSTVAIWSGGGFNISFLKNAAWLSDKKIRYWGDIDEHGFQILHQLRSYHPHAQSIMMDRTTFETFQNYAVSGARNKSQNLNLLSKEENDLFQYLKALEKNRLEQEKIPQVYIDRCLKNRIES